MEIGRVYEHKGRGDGPSYGAIGNVVLNAPGIVLEIDGKVLPDASIRAVLRHGLQILQDAYAGAKSQDEARGLFSKKLTKLLAGTLGERGISDELSSVETEIAKAWATVKKMTFAKGVPTAERYADALAAWESDDTPLHDKVEAFAKAKVVADAAARAALAALGGSGLAL